MPHPKMKAAETRREKAVGSISTTSFNDEEFIERAREIDQDELTHDIAAAGSATLGDNPPGGAPQPAEPVVELPPDPYLVQTLAGLVTSVVNASKAAGWEGVAVPGMVVEDDWKAAVTDRAAVVVQKRFPTLAANASPEAALLALAFPWCLWAGSRLLVAAMAALKKKRERLGTRIEAPSRDGYLGRNGRGENLAHDSFVETTPEDISV